MPFLTKLKINDLNKVSSISLFMLDCISEIKIVSLYNNFNSLI